MRGAADVGHHHAEAVVKGYRDAEPVLFTEVDQLRGEVAVVQDVAVAQSCALGDPVVPEVYWMLIGSLLLSCDMRSASASECTWEPSSISSSQSLLSRYTTRSKRHDGMGPRQLAVLNSRRQPARAIFVGSVVNAALLLFVGSVLGIILAANIAVHRRHTSLAHRLPHASTE